MESVVYIPARYNASAKQFEILLLTNVAGNVFMSLESDETVAGAIDDLRKQLGRLEIKDNMTATADPTIADYKGFSPGSKWFNHTNGFLWVCKSINESGATWTPMAAGTGN